jgi:hypothetical protein
MAETSRVCLRPNLHSLRLSHLHERCTPPLIPPPATHSTQYFDLGEPSSGCSSSSRASGFIHHRAGQERILIGVNSGPLHLPGSPPGQFSRVQVINDIKESILWAEMDDGLPLPEWLGFDNQEAEFLGNSRSQGSQQVYH